MRRAIVIAVPLLILGLSPAGRAAAPCAVPSATYPTIQSAINDASCTPITVAAGTYAENLAISRSVEVVGAGIGVTVIDGVTGTVVEVIGTDPYAVKFADLTVTGGGSGGGPGGGFRLLGSGAHVLTLLGVAVTGNVGASSGGGVSLDQAELVMTGGEITGNQVTGNGGAISGLESRVTLNGVHVDGNKAATGGAFYLNRVLLEIHGSTVDRNEATDSYGGFVGLDGAGATLTDTTIRGNTAVNLNGGGLLAGNNFVGRRLLVDGNSAADVGGLEISSEDSASLEDSAITNNTARGGSVGGLYLNAASAGVPTALVNTTISGNQATGDAGGLGIDFGTFTGTNVTIADNTADSDDSGSGGSGGSGGGVVKGGPGTATFRNTIISSNTIGSQTPGVDECDGPFTSEGHNILGDRRTCEWTDGPGDLIGVHPLHAPLADNGGNTLTRALHQRSPAVNAADPAFAPATDQRGLPRAAPDIGAYELVLCAKVAVNVIGTEGNDKLTGTKEYDGIIGLGGKDTLNGGRGRDGLCGGAGKDTLKGGGGTDNLRGGGGKDICIGGPARDKAVCEKEKKI